MLLLALFVSVDRRITLKSLKAALEPHIGTSVDNFKVLCHYVSFSVGLYRCCLSLKCFTVCLSVGLSVVVSFSVGNPFIACLFVCLSICLCLSTCLPVYVSVFQSANVQWTQSIMQHGALIPLYISLVFAGQCAGADSSVLFRCTESVSPDKKQKKRICRTR